MSQPTLRLTLILLALVASACRPDLNEVDRARLTEACRNLKAAADTNDPTISLAAFGDYERVRRGIEDKRGRLIPSKYDCGS